MAFGHHLSQDWKASPSYEQVTMTESSINGCFDCNICLDFAREPVVTHCGHLYCWPCMYKWLLVQTDSLASDERPQCPVCKAHISYATIIPLYGRGQAAPAQTKHAGVEKALCREILIPPRPPASGVQDSVATLPQSSQQLPYRHPYHNQRFGDEASSSRMLNVGATLSLTPGFRHPMAGMFGEMVYARVFGSPENLYAHTNSYHLMGGNGSRLRRQEIQADKSLKRISIFLFCCILLCLVVF